MTTFRLSASIVTYHSPQGELERLLESLVAAVEYAQQAFPATSLQLTLIDNAETPTLDVRELGLDLSRLNAANVSITLQQGFGNVGYGKAHNRVLAKLDSDYHLILNSDVELATDSLSKLFEYLQSFDDAEQQAGADTPQLPVLISPAATDFLGNKQHLCKSYPSLFIFWLRGFAPPFMKRKFVKKMAAYERRDLDTKPALKYGRAAQQQDAPTASKVEIVSGCCMLCRSDALVRSGGFDPKFFLYFEDFDLSIRLGKLGEVVYLPTLRVRHGGGNAAQKGKDHQRYFMKSAVTFFNKHGWRLF